MAEESGVICCNSIKIWNQYCNPKENVENKLVVVDFSASWCAPCRVMSPVFLEHSKKFSNVVFLKVDVDELQVVAKEWKVNAMPTFIFIIGGKEQARIVGANKDELLKLLVTYTDMNPASVSV